MMQHRTIAAALVACALLATTPAPAQLSIGISVRVAPPPLPVYAQPPLPGPDYLWTPGYWAWDDDAAAYFWVPGTWVRAPRPGLLWTPPWWGWSDGLYLFHPGYWGPRVGFYGGVPYGYGYTGLGFFGGYWNGGHVFYNRSVTNVTRVTNVTTIYEKTVVVNRATRVSYNGGPGGLQSRPNLEQQGAARDPHVAPTSNQQAHFASARSDPRAFVAANHGRPPVPATARPLAVAAARPQRLAGQAPIAEGSRRPLADRAMPPRAARPGNPSPPVMVERGAARPAPAASRASAPPTGFDRPPRPDRVEQGGRPPRAAPPPAMAEHTRRAPPPPAPDMANRPPHQPAPARPPSPPHPRPAPHPPAPHPHSAEHHEEHH